MQRRLLRCYPGSFRCKMACAQHHLMQETNPSFPHFCWVLFVQRPAENAESGGQRDRRRRRKVHCGCAPPGEIERAERFRMIQSAPPSDAQKPRTNASVASPHLLTRCVFQGPANRPQHQLEPYRRRRRKGHCGSAPASKKEHAKRFRLI